MAHNFYLLSPVHTAICMWSFSSLGKYHGRSNILNTRKRVSLGYRSNTEKTVEKQNETRKETSGRFFQVISPVSEIKSVKTDFGCCFFLFHNPFDFVSLAA